MVEHRAAFLRAIQSRAARIAVGPSTVRGQGGKGVVKAGRGFLRQLNLRQFATGDPRRFNRTLDRVTESLKKALPRPARSWGLARKVLNIFLRDCLYTVYLRNAYRLGRAEHLLELPLDSITARQLKREFGRGALPGWPGVKHNTPGLSREFQDAALVIAKAKGLARIHLDAYWWSQSRDDEV